MPKQSPKNAVHIASADWRGDDPGWRGLIEGADLNADTTIIFYATDEVGKGPSWHVHPYDEVFIIRKGRARFKIGSRVIDAGEGDVLMGPAAVPHKYENLGPGRLESIDIHLSRAWIQEDLEDPDEM